MIQDSAQLSRFFVRPQYSISYRRLPRFQRTIAGHSDYEVLLLLSGELRYEVDNRASALSARQSLLIEPGTALKLTGRNSESVSLILAPAFLLEYAARAHLVSAAATFLFEQRAIRNDERLSRLAGDLAAELAETEPGQEIVIAALVQQLVMHLLRRHARMRRADELELSRAGLIDRRIRRAVELMHGQLDRDLSLAEIAAASFVSPFHFARLFKKLTGTTPHAYHAGLRIKRGQALLAETDLSITKVSTLVGYSSPSHFTKAFRQATGLTPRAFRSALVSRRI